VSGVVGLEAEPFGVMASDLSDRGAPRQLLGSSAPPFVFLTGLAPEFADAAATFVRKPCDFDQLLGVVGRHCRA